MDFVTENNVAPRFNGSINRLSVQLMRYNGKTGLLLDGYCFGEIVGLPVVLTSKPKMFRLANFVRPDGKRPDCAKLSTYVATYDGIIRMSADDEGNISMDFAIEIYSTKGNKSYGYRADNVVMKNIQSPQVAWADVDRKANAERDRQAAIAKQKAVLTATIAKANGGDVDAMAALGYMYTRGDGAPRDSAEGIRWYKVASSKGDRGAAFSLGGIYFSGAGVEQDYVEAARHYKIAASRGSLEAMYNLGLMAKEGRGMPASLSEAKRWMNMAAEKGSDDAVRWLKAYSY